MSFSWIQNSRTPCCLEATSAVFARWTGGSQLVCRTLVAAADNSTQLPYQHNLNQQQQQQDSPLHRASLSSNSVPSGASLLPRLQAAARASTWQQPCSWQQSNQQQHLLHSPLHQHIQCASISTSSSSQQDLRQHGIHPSAQPFWTDIPSGSSSGASSFEQRQQSIQGEVTGQSIPQDSYADGNGTSFRPRSFRRKEPQFQVSSA